MASAVPIITGMMAAVNVLGRAANSQAWAELRVSSFMVRLRFERLGGKDTSKSPIFAFPNVENYEEITIPLCCSSLLALLL